MIFRQLFDTTSPTYTNILGCDGAQNAIIIDPVDVANIPGGLIHWSRLALPGLVATR